MSANVEITRHGFVYGPAHVERIGEHPAGYASLHISGGRGKWIEVFVSPGGDSIRVYDQDGNELTAPARSEGVRTERTRIIEKVEAKRLSDTSLATYEAYNKALDDVLAAIREEA